MLDSAQRFLTNAPSMAVWPAIAIVSTVLSFNLVGEGPGDALDPKERQGVQTRSYLGLRSV